MTGVVVVARADEVLRRFFLDQASALAGRALERLRSAESDLRAALDAFAPRLLTSQELALLTLERQFEPSSAAARVAGADVLLLLLPLFLDDPHWHGAAVEDRRLRIRLAEPLAETVAREPSLRDADLAKAVWIVEAAVRHEIWLLRQEREAARRG